MEDIALEDLAVPISSVAISGVCHNEEEEDDDDYDDDDDDYEDLVHHLTCNGVLEEIRFGYRSKCPNLC